MTDPRGAPTIARGRRGLGRPLLGAAALLGAVLTVQMLTGAFDSERGLYSDEAAHLLNGVLLRDYLLEGYGQPPVDFAREYYRHYPKIAPFMWPPLFHTVLGIALLPGWSPMITAMVLLALCTTWIAWRLYRIVATFSSVPVALGSVSILLTMPAVIGLTTSVMIDIVVAAFALEAAFWLGRFADTGRTRDAVCFGITTACACMAKGNGLSAVLAPAVLLLVSGGFTLLRRPGLYVAGAIVVALAVPPLYVAFVLDATLGDFARPTLLLIWDRWRLYSSFAWQQLGPLPGVFALVGVGTALARQPWLRKEAQAMALGLVAIVGGAIVFHLLNPHILSDQRYFTLALPPLLGLAGLGVTAVARAASGRVPWALRAAAVLLVAATQAASMPALRAQVPLGYRSMMTFLNERNALAGRRLLIVSNEQGEGAGVVEAAVLSLRPAPMILRGSKILASDDWMGRNFALRYQSEDALLTDLEAMHVDYVLLDGSGDARALGYWAQMLGLVTRRADRFETLRDRPADAVHGPLRPLVLYRLKFKAPGPPKHIELTGSSPFISGR